MARIVVKLFLYGECDSDLMACAKHALILTAFGVLFLPAVALGQAQTPEAQILAGVHSRVLLNSNLQAPQENQQRVGGYHLILSDHQNSFNPLFEAIDVNGGEPSGRIFFPYPSSLLIPLQDSSTDNSGPSINASESVGDRSRNLQQVPGDAQISFAILEGNSKTFTIKLGDQPSGRVAVTITGYEGTDLEVSPTQLMFDDSNWNVEQTVTVNVKQESDDDEVKLIFEASGDGIKESISIDVRVLDTSPVPVNLSAEESELERGRRLAAVTSLRPFTRLITGEVPLKFEKDMSEGDGKSYNTVPKIPIPLDAKSAVTEIQTGEGTDQNNEAFTVTSDGNLLPPGIELGSSSSVEGAINDGEGSPQFCLEISPDEVSAGEWVTVKATITSVQSYDIGVSIHFRLMGNIFDPASIIFDNPGGQEKSVTILAGKRESGSFRFKTRWVGLGYNSGYLWGKPNVAYIHRACLCPLLTIRPPPLVTLSASPNPVEEGQPVTITARISDAPSSDVTIPLYYPNAQTIDAAVDPGDYTSLTSITIKANKNEGTGKIQTHDDNTEENDERFTVAIDGDLLPPGIELGRRPSVQVTINDNDASRVRFASSTGKVNEDVGTHNVEVAISPAPGADITVNYSLGGTATIGTDYTSSGTVSVPANATSVNIPVVITDDDIDDDDETVILTLTGGTGYNLGSPKVHRLTINDNAPQIRFRPSGSSEFESKNWHNVIVNIDPVPGSDLTVNYSLGGTATEGTDFEIGNAIPVSGTHRDHMAHPTQAVADYEIKNSRTFSVPASSQGVFILVKINDDTVNENSETIILTLESGTGYEVGSPGEYTLTITDNDAPTVRFVSETGSVGENGGTHNMEVNISPAPGTDLTLTYALSGTATRGTDYTSSGTVSISAGATSVNIPVVITDDIAAEDAETVILTLESGTEYTVGSPSEHTLTINDNDMPTVHFASSTGSADEDVGTHNVEVSISPASGSGLTLSYTLGGTATEDADYTSSGTVSVPANATSVNIPVVITDDTLDEYAETVILTLESGTGYAVGSPSEHTLTITDNDVPTVHFVSSTGSVGENGGTHNVEVSISPASGSGLTLSYTLGGTATEDTDYSITGSGAVSVSAGATSVSIPVVITDDTLDEYDETVILTLTGGTGYTVGSPSEHTLTITDNDAPTVHFVSSTGSVDENGGTHNVEVSISPASGSGLTLSYTLGGTATEDTDYSMTGSGTVSVSAGATSVSIPVEITDDTLDEDAETVILTLTGGAGYNVGSPSEHTLTINDNDAPTVHFASSTGIVDENGGTHNVEVSIGPAPGSGLTLTYSLGGTATEDADYTSSGTVSVSAGATSVNIPVVITDDDLDDDDETVILTLESGAGYNVGSPSEHTLTVTDNDAPEVRFASSASSVGEDGGAHNVEVSIGPAPGSDLMVSYTLGGTATKNTDYTSSGAVSVAAGATSVNIPVVITDDDLDEADEAVILTLESGTGYTVGSPGTHTLTIVDDDHSPSTSAHVRLSASPNPVDEGESVTITATLSEALPDAVTIRLRDIPGEPPTEPGDYRPLERITIPGGVLTGSGTIEIRDDDVSEGDERFTVAVDELPPEVELGSPSSVEITILDNDPPPPVEVALSAFPNPVEEGSSVTVTATLTGVLEADVVVPLVYNDETSHPPEPGDYTQVSGITIASGETEGSEQIQTSVDADSDDEAFIVALGDLPPAQLVPGRESSQSVTIRDMSAEVVVNLSAAPNPVDEGDEVTVTAALSEVLNTDVTIPLVLTAGTADDEDYEVSPPVQVEIEAGETSGTYAVSIVQDDVAEGSETFTVALGTLPSGLAKGDRHWVELTITDDDAAGIEAPSSVSVVEEGEHSFDISLTSEPSDEVSVTMSWPSGTDLTLRPITRIFTPENWHEGQQVILRAAEDADVMDDQVVVTLTASGSVDYTGISETISVTITDNDAAGIVVPASVTMAEGSERTLGIALAQMPSGPVTVTFSGYAGTDLSLNGSPLTFTPANWSQEQTVTLTAAEDDDLENDTETLTLTASGGGYDGVTAEIAVTIMDNDAAGIVAPEEVRMDEGGTYPLLVRLSAQPSGPATVTFSGHAGTDLALDKTSLTFTAADWQTSKPVTLTAMEDDDDYADDTIGLTLAASGGGYDGEAVNLTVTITDNDERPGPLTITIYDEQELENEGAIQLPIELSRPTDQMVTVQYASMDGTAEAGEDYMTSRGIVIFDPGATRGVIEIEVTDDDLPEGAETFMVTLSKSHNATIARATGTGTILDDDGGTAILRVDDALVLEEEGMVRFRVSLSHPQRQLISAAYQTQDGTARAGEDYEASSGVVTLAPGTVEATIAVPLLKDGLDWQEETFTMHLMSSKHAEIARAVGVATIQESTTVSEAVLEAYSARFVRTSSAQIVEALGERFRSGADGAVCGAADRAEMAQLWYSASEWDPSLGELLSGCRMSASSYSGAFSVWGRGAFRQFNGRTDDALTLSGEVTTGMLGVDYRWQGGWLAGVLLAHSRGDGSFEVVQQSGEITAGLTGVYPYVSYAHAGWDVWLSAGAGRGQAEVLELKGDLVSKFGAMGVRGTLVSSGTIGLNYHGDVLVTDAELKDHDVTAEVYRVRAGVEANAKISDGLRPYVEASVRSDGGSAETGIGLEFGGGIRVDYPAWRLKGDVRTQGLVMHTAEGFTEWGLSGSLQVGSRSEGLMVRVRPTWGRGQGMSVYGQQTILDATPIGANAQRTELELGYGIPWKDGTVRSVMGVTQLPQGMMYRLGGELYPWERLTFSVFGLAHSRAATLGDLGINVRGSLRY